MLSETKNVVFVNALYGYFEQELITALRLHYYCFVSFIIRTSNKNLTFFRISHIIHTYYMSSPIIVT